MNLSDLISALEALPPDAVVAKGFANPHSYRGHYAQLAFEPEADTTVAAMLDAARSAVGEAYEGWKGGDYTMGFGTTVFLAKRGDTGDPITPTMIACMVPGPRRDSASPGDLRAVLLQAIEEVVEPAYAPNSEAVADNCIAALTLAGLIPVEQKAGE